MPDLDCGVTPQAIAQDRTRQTERDEEFAMNISEKPVALVTGASSGMGKDFALRLLEEGYVVYGAARRVERMQEIAEAGGITLNMDVTLEHSMLDGIHRIITDHGRIDVLINNAGYGQYGALEEVPIDLARRQMEVNLFGLGRLTQLCLPHMRRRKQGKIINISSIGGKIVTPLGGWYHASKFALEGWSDVLRNEVRPFGIDVVVIEPGGIQSEWAGIAIEEAQRLSGNGPYSNLVRAFAKAQSSMKAPPPTVITELVIAAVKSSRPRPRYSGGLMAKPMLFLRHVLTDRMFDRLIMSAFR
jgi:NAD(P)-dependent dehydrogenase (short-subunit alcohol dehydrogenase family)